MEKKIVQLTQAFDHLRFEQCLRMSDQILKKMEKSDGKKKINLSDLQYRSLYLTRIGSLASIGLLHEANELINQKFKQPVVSQESSFLFLQICSLAFDRRIPQFVSAIIQNKDKKNIDINRFILLTRNFSQLSRIFLRKFATSKKNSDSFTQVYLEYLQQLNNHKMISYKRDKIILEQKKLQFKFVSMFLEKFVSNFKASQLPPQRLDKNYHQKTHRAIVDLKLKIAIHEGNSGLVRNLFIQNYKDIQTNIFIYLRSLRALTNQRQQNSVFWRQQFLKIFRNNLNLDNYQPIYDFSMQFLNSLINQSGINLLQLSDPQIIKQQQLYIFKNNLKQQVQNYINSLFTDYSLLKQKQKQNKNKDFYKISTKNCLLLLIYALSQCKKYQLVRKFLWTYKQDNGKKLTFYDQINKYFSNPQIFTAEYYQQYRKAPQKLENNQDKIIWLVNYERMYAKNPLKQTLQQNRQQWQRLRQLYQVNLKQVQKQKKLEKGQRYLSDQLLTIMADSIRKYTQQAQITQIQRQELYSYALGILQEAVVKSPHNHDNKLRAIFYLNKFNYSEDALKLLQSLDIKAVQFQTLGYFHLKNIINFGSWDTNQQLLTRMLKSYHENNRQSSQYAYKALLGISFNQCEQNMCYHDNITRSYNLIVLLYTLYMKNKGRQNCKFYLNQILQRIKQSKDRRLTLNADFKIIKNVMDPNGRNYVDFYGIYNNCRVLEAQCQVRLLVIGILGGESEESINQLRKSILLVQDLKQVYNFSDYEIFDKKLEYQFSGQQVHHEKITGIQLRLHNRINKIILDICDFVISIRKQGNINEQFYKNIHKQTKQLNEFISGLTWRQQVLFLPSLRFSISEVISILGAQVQTFSAKKKKVEGQAQKKQYCQELIGSLIECVSDGVKIQERLLIDKKYSRQSFIHRDNLLDRMTKMTGNEYKKFYKLKI